MTVSEFVNVSERTPGYAVERKKRFSRYAKRVGAAALAGIAFAGGAKGMSYIMDDGVADCGDRVVIREGASPNASVDIDGTVYGIDATLLAGAPLITLTEGRLYHERAENAPIVMPIKQSGNTYVGEITLGSSDQTFSVTTSGDFDTLQTSCS